MGRPRGDGIKIVRKRKADGTVMEYRYARPRPETPEADDGTLRSLIREYRRTPNYRRLKPGTQKLYDQYLDQIEAHIGHLAVRSFRASHIQRIRDDLQATPRKANMWLAMLSILFNLAKRRDLIATNPAANPGRLTPNRRSEVWQVEDEARVLDAFRPRLRLAFLLLLYTVQRPSDVLAMTTAQISERDGRLYIQLRQQKTDALVAVPVHSRLEPLVRERLATRITRVEVDRAGRRSEVETLLLVPSPKGLAWQRRNFARVWDFDLARANYRLARELFAAGYAKDQVRAELDGRHRQRRDLRRTGIVRLAEAGATTPQIAAVSGHSIDYCQSIIDTYLPRRAEVALGGIEAWERADAAPKVVRFRNPDGSGNHFGNRKLR